MTRPFPDVFLVLSGGAGRRLGGVDKAALIVGGRRLLDRAIDSAAGRLVVLIGPEIPVPNGVLITRESPPGGGPAAGVSAGVRLLSERRAGEWAAGALIAILAVDQAGVTVETWHRLAEAVSSDEASGAVLVADGRRQYGVAVIRWQQLRAAVSGEDSWHGKSLRRLLDDVISADIVAVGAEHRDVDTLADVTWWQEHGDVNGEGDSDDGTG